MLEHYWQLASDFVTHLWHSVHWMSSPVTIGYSLIALVLVGGFLMYWNMSRYRSLLEFWSEGIEAGVAAPKSARQLRNLWILTLAVLLVMVVSLGGPNITGAPLTVPKGSVQVEFAFDVSNSMASQPYRPFYAAMSGQSDPGASLQWGTTLDAAKSLVKEDLLPQLVDNEAGLMAAGGKGYNTWDITRELSDDGAFMHMLNEHLKVGAAPFGGSDYADVLQMSLAEFDLVSSKERALGDLAPKTRFIVLIGDGGNTSKEEDLDKVLAEINKRQIHLLLVEVGGPRAMSVPKYDPKTHRANGLFYMKVDSPNEVATTVTQPVTLTGGEPVRVGYPLERSKVANGEKVFLHILQKVPDSDLIYAPPGTMHINYSFPEKLGGLVAVSNESNIRPWLLLVAFVAFLLIAIGGGGIPRWRVFMPEVRPLISSVFVFVRGGYKSVLTRKR